MFAMTVHVIVYVLLALWGGVLAALIGWILCSVIVDTAATVWPRSFPGAARRLYLRKLKKVQALDRRQAKDAFNRRTPPGFGQACSDTIKMILEGGPDYFARNGIKPPRRRRRRTKY